MLSKLTPTALTKNSMTVSWLTMLVLLLVAVLSSFNFIETYIGSFVLGLLFIASGTIMFFESIYEGGQFRLDDIKERPSDIVGILTGIMAYVLSYGLFTGNTFILTHFMGLSGGLLLFLLVYLIFEGFKNRN